MKNFMYIILVASMLVACGKSGGKKKAGGGTVAVTPTSHQSNRCQQLLPAALAISEYSLDSNRVYRDRFYDSQGQSYKIRQRQHSQYNGRQQANVFIDTYTRETFTCNRLYAIDTYIEQRYGVPRVCADYRYDNYSRRFVHKYQNNTYVEYDYEYGDYIMPDNSQLNCPLNYQDNYYWGLFYSVQANYQTGYYRNFNFQAGGNGSFKDFLKAGVLFGIGAAIINHVNK